MVRAVRRESSIVRCIFFINAKIPNQVYSSFFILLPTFNNIQMDSFTQKFWFEKCWNFYRRNLNNEVFELASMLENVKHLITN